MDSIAPQSHPRVTVFVPVYNGEPFLAETIQSVLTQTFPDFELLVVDDCSTDRSASLVRQFADPRIRLVHNDRNRGRSYTRNRGLMLARGEYVAVLDADDVCEPLRLEETVAYLDAHPKVAAVGSAATIVDSAGRALFVLRPPAASDAVRARLFTVNCFIHSSVSFRRKLVLAAGGYDEQLQQAEDYELFMRLSAKHQLANLDIALVRYRVHDSQVSQRELKEQRRLADRARVAAFEDQLRRGLISDDIRAPDLSWLGRLTGREGTIGADYLYWASIKRATGQPSAAAILAARAVISAPFSGRAWRTARRATLAALVPVRIRSALTWYAKRALRSSRGRT
jgi:glycosyltransferase involved in cell wall biosynthesis